MKNQELETSQEQLNSSFFRSSRNINIDFDTDFKFFAIIPAININLHSKSLEIEWLFWGLYIGF
jgi:hypothetical protein